MVGLAQVAVICRGFCQARRGSQYGRNGRVATQPAWRPMYSRVMARLPVSSRANRGISQLTKLGFERIEQAKGVA